MFFKHPATSKIYTLSLHDALPILPASHDGGAPSYPLPQEQGDGDRSRPPPRHAPQRPGRRSEEHTSELQSHSDLVCRLLLEKKNRLSYLSDAIAKYNLFRERQYYF